MVCFYIMENNSIFNLPTFKAGIDSIETRFMGIMKQHNFKCYYIFIGYFSPNINFFSLNIFFVYYNIKLKVFQQIGEVDEEI